MGAVYQPETITSEFDPRNACLGPQAQYRTE